PKRQPVIFTDC
ncbi:hypothetical protein ECEC1864_0942, partial [Escherichia coli EC1864]